MLQFTTPALLTRQATGQEPPRRANRHAAIAPHGCFAASGYDQWVVLAATNEKAFAALARLLGHEEWLADGACGSLGWRMQVQSELEEAIGAWTGTREAAQAARELQEHGIASAPVVHVEELPFDPHLNSVGFFVDIDRPVSKRQRQAGLAIRERGRRFYAARPAPTLGGDTKAVLAEQLQVDDARFEAFCKTGVVNMKPTALRVTTVLAHRAKGRSSG